MPAPKFNKDILVAAIGLTLQVITETLYCLTRKRNPVNISEIYAITTEAGKELILEQLLRNKKGAFYLFCNDYGIKPSSIKFDESTIIVLKDAFGRPLSDIRSEDDNIAVANSVAGFISDLTANPRVRLHCSIAGGRKTMGVFLACALQLFGRRCDSLYHVLVTPEFESHSDFFYKPKKDKILTCRDTLGKVKEISTKKAKIELAGIPFVRLRGKLPSLFGEKHFSYTEMVEQAQKEIDNIRSNPDLIINIPERKIQIGDKSASIRPLEMALILYFARMKLDGCVNQKQPTCNDCTKCFKTIDQLTTTETACKILDAYGCLYSENSGFYIGIEQNWLKSGPPPDRIRENISKIKKTVSGLTDSTLYHISSVRRYGGTQYGIHLDRSKIKIKKTL